MATSPSPQDDIILGTAGPDTINALEGNDRVSGLLGDDDLDGGAGDDAISGDEGNDTLRVSGTGRDSADGGVGTDLLVVDYSDDTEDVRSSGPGATPALGGFSGFISSFDGRQVSYTSIERFDIKTGIGNDDIIVAGGNATVSLGAGFDSLDIGLTSISTDNNKGDGGANLDDISANFSGSSGAINWNLQTSTFNGDSGKFINFEFFGVLQGSDFNDTIVTADIDRPDTIRSGAGDDRVTVVRGSADFVNGEDGLDTLVIDYSRATRAVVTFTAPTADAVYGGFKGTYYDLFDHGVSYNGIERFEITTGSGDDRIVTPGGDDIVRTGAGNDIIDGGGGNDSLDPGTGDDAVSGGDGNDFLFFGGAFTNADSADGGAGTDTLALLGNYTLAFDSNDLVGIERLFLFNGNRFDPAGAPASYNLTTIDANVGPEGLFVTAASLRSNETLFFNGAAETDGAFRVQGGAGADTIIGGGQGDYLTGNAGNDILSGKGGDDYIVGGAGADQLRGGFGSDVFRFLSAADSTPDAPDRIADFQLGEKIDLAAIDANTSTEGDQAFAFIGGDQFSAKGEGQVRATYDANTKLWSVEGDIDGNGTTDFLILVSRPNSELPITANEFVL